MDESDSTLYTYRRVTHKMGGWKWGYPRGHRIGITRYVARPDRQGILRWYADGCITSGLTARTAVFYSDPVYATAEAFRHPVGSLHRKRVNP